MSPKHRPHDAATAAPDRRAPESADVWERWHVASHPVFYALLALCTVATLSIPEVTRPQRAVAVGLAALLGGWYWFAVLAHPRWIRARPLEGLGYFAVMGLLFFGLVSVHPTYTFLSFCLYWQVFSYWTTRWAVPGSIALSGLIWWQSGLEAEGVQPVVPPGAFLFFIAVTVSTVLSLFVSAIIRQSEGRKRLIAQLEATRNELAEEERRAGTLEERGRLAREIHDTLAQGFVGIVTHLEVAERELPPGSDAARRRIDMARRTARENLVEARRLVTALRPEILEGGSLAGAIRRVAARWSEETGVRADLTVTGREVALPQDVQVALLRAAQEGLANAARHAGAGRVAITLSYLEDEVLLDVQDDGRGFDPGRARAGAAHGFGLEGMRERIERLGGRLLVESGWGEGTTLAIQLPLTAERQPQLPQEVR